LDTLFLTWRCMVPWNHWFILACLFVWAIQIGEWFFPLFLKEPNLIDVLEMTTQGNSLFPWTHNIQITFPSLPTLPPFFFPMITFFGYQVIGCYKNKTNYNKHRYYNEHENNVAK
jgi:hypothetical protein